MICMKAKLFALVIGSSLVLITPALHAGDTNATPQAQPRKEGQRGGFALLPPPLIEKLNLTDEQKTKLKAIEESFGKAQQEYLAAHKDEIDAARKAMETAMAGLQDQRKSAMEQLKALLTPEQAEQIHGGKGEGRGTERGAERGTEHTPERSAVKPPPE